VKAILHSQYGTSDLLQLKEIYKPAPKDNEVLIAIHATTVSTADCNISNFTFVTRSMLPLAKLTFGIGKPWKARVLGTELAGEVDAVGKGVTRFKRGDRVVASTGMAGGGHARTSAFLKKERWRSSRSHWLEMRRLRFRLGRTRRSISSATSGRSKPVRKC
jgi:NADPH:quinone reductase-like Zn-dependent oxidoreductase